MNYQFALFAKSPVPGSVKTRLNPPLTAESACELYAAFFSDCVRKALLLVDRPVVYHDGPVELLQDALRLHMGSVPDIAWTPQADGDIGQRLTEVPAPCLVIASDSPTIPLNFLQQAADQLDHADVVLGPAIDGGFYLIGLRSESRGIFEGIPWETPNVLTATREHIAMQELSTRLLPPWYHIVTVDDLRRLRVEMETVPVDSPDDAPYTRAALASLEF